MRNVLVLGGLAVIVAITEHTLRIFVAQRMIIVHIVDIVKLAGIVIVAANAIIMPRINTKEIVKTKAISIGCVVFVAIGIMSIPDMVIMIGLAPRCILPRVHHWDILRIIVIFVVM